MLVVAIGNSSNYSGDWCSRMNMNILFVLTCIYSFVLNRMIQTHSIFSCVFCIYSSETFDVVVCAICRVSMPLCWRQLWLCFHVVCLPYSYECDIWGPPWGNLLKFGTNNHLTSRMNWLDFCFYRSKVTVTSHPFNFCECDIWGPPTGVFFKFDPNIHLDSQMNWLEWVFTFPYLVVFSLLVARFSIWLCFLYWLSVSIFGWVLCICGAFL